MEPLTGASIPATGEPVALRPPAFRTPLVATKLAPPPLPRHYRERACLSERLDAALHDATRLTLVSAPPGYGKSVAVAGWLASRGTPAAWLTLEPADNDLVRFVRYLVAALRKVRPNAGAATLDLLATGASPGMEQLGATILEEIAVSDEPFVLVLDDYHVITAEPIHRLVGFLIAHGPPFAHPILLAREDPPLPLARLRAHARLVELRVADLRYAAEEASTYLAAMAVRLAPEQLEQLVDRTEGWIVGLQLAAVSLRDRPDPGAIVEAFAGSRRAVFDYLAGEVMAGLDGDLRAFVIRTSIADRLTPELCDELTGRSDSSTFLARAEQANLFLIRADAAQGAYRYHQLFADYLRSLLSEEERRELHERVADHLEREGFAQEAMGHALAAGSIDRAVRLLEREARPTFESGELSTLLGWLDALPPERVAASSELASLQAWALMFTGRLAEAMGILQGRLGTAGPHMGGPAEGRLLALQSLLAAVTGPAATVPGSNAVELGRAALELLGDDDFFRALTLQSIGMATWSSGDLAAGFERWREAYEAATRSGQPMTVLPAVAALASGLNDIGRRREGEALCRQTLAEFVDWRGRPRPIAWLVRMTLGLLLYEANDLTEARQELERGFEAAGSYGFGGAMVVWAVEYLALVRQATGSQEAALEAVHATSRGVRSAGMALPSQTAEIEARIRLMQGELAAAALWADHATPDAPAGSPMLGQIRADQDVAIARVRLAQGRPDEALALLRPVKARAETLGAVADLIAIRVLEASAEEAAGRRAAAQRALEEAIRLAAPGGYVRRIVDDGGHVAHLLPLVRNAAPTFVDLAVAALRPGRGRGAAPAADAAASARSQLLETLTARELDVLRLMGRGASDAEIAQGLFVSLATAKWHAANVRGKLGAKSRTQALVRAQELGLV